MILVDAGGARQVDRPAVGGHAHQVAVGGDQERGAVRRQAVVDAAQRVLDPHGSARVALDRRSQRPVVGNLDRDGAERLARWVEPVEPAALLEDDPSHAEGRPVYVVVGEVRDLTDRSGVEVHHPDVLPKVRPSVGHEEELLSGPHRVGVGPLPVGEPRQGLRGEVVAPEVLVLAAEIALAQIEVAEDAVVDDLAPVRRERHQSRSVQGQLFRLSNVQRDGERVMDIRIERALARQIDDTSPVRRPPEDEVAAVDAVEGQPPRWAVFARHYIYVAGVPKPARVGDEAPVRREMRCDHLAWTVDDPSRRPTAQWRGPQAVPRHERDLPGARRRKPREHIGSPGAACGGQQDKYKNAKL